MSKERINHILLEVEDALSKTRGKACESAVFVDSEFLCRSLSVLNFSEPMLCGLKSSVHQVCQQLQQSNTGCVIVEKNDGLIAGVFSERDYMLRIYDQDLDLNAVAISEYMTPEPTTVQPDDTIAYCLSLMSLGGFRHLPVVDPEGLPIGLLSIRDIVDGLTERILKFC